jgi:hypothetical protein
MYINNKFLWVHNMRGGEERERQVLIRTEQGKSGKETLGEFFGVMKFVVLSLPHPHSRTRIKVLFCYSV